jgi:hypothetical protein
MSKLLFTLLHIAVAGVEQSWFHLIVGIDELETGEGGPRRAVRGNR